MAIRSMGNHPRRPNRQQLIVQGISKNNRPPNGVYITRRASNRAFDRPRERGSTCPQRGVIAVYMDNNDASRDPSIWFTSPERIYLFGISCCTATSINFLKEPLRGHRLPKTPLCFGHPIQFHPSSYLGFPLLVNGCNSTCSHRRKPQPSSCSVL